LLFKVHAILPDWLECEVVFACGEIEALAKLSPKKEGAVTLDIVARERLQVCEFWANKFF
jgi:hypothetical protein